ncbi:hypothetical protein LJC48_05125, partial [Desulfovibrio sp. OttesenSCG-928-C06]|nr:hypothetical protein [Desulfovibrio sp. OttesenSCG-928-C06]
KKYNKDNHIYIAIKNILLAYGINVILSKVTFYIEKVVSLIFKIVRDRIAQYIYQHKLNQKIRKYNIKAIIIPVTITTTADALYMPQPGSIPCISISFAAMRSAKDFYCSHYIQKLQNAESFLGRIARKYFTEWAYYSDNKAYFAQRPEQLLTNFFCGLRKNETINSLREKYPWACLHSAKNKDVLASYGPLPGTWQITGDLHTDALYAISNQKAAKFAEISAEYGFLHKRLLAFDYHQFNLLGDDGNYTEFLLTVAQKARDLRWDVIFCPHPKIPDALRALPSQLGLPVAKHPTHEILPCAELYVSYGGSTTRWAKQLGLPLVVYNVFRNDAGASLGAGSAYFDYNNRSSFAAFLLDLIANDQRLAALRQQAEADAKNWGICDGKCTDRILDYIDNVIAVNERL